MGAADVIGPDLQLRLGVDYGVVGKNQVLIGLLGIGLLRVLADDDAAVEDGGRLAVENALVDLMTIGVRLGVVDDGVIVDVLRAAGDIEAVDSGLRAFGKYRADVVADELASERDIVAGEVGAAAALAPAWRRRGSAWDDSRWIL